MSTTTGGQILGAAAAVGAITMLPYTSSSPLLHALSLLIKVSCTLVLVSMLALKISLWLYEKKSKVRRTSR